MVASFGEELRRERELRAISLREIAQATKVNLCHLEAIERDEFSALPGGVYNKGIVRAYCTHIGLDVESMVDAYLAQERALGDPSITPDGLLRRRGPLAARREPAVRSSRTWIWGFVVVIASGVLTVAYFLYT